MWLLKTEPDDYSYDQLEQKGRTCWDGVKNPAALKNIREMKAGDRAFLYHTGKEKAVVGVVEVVKAAYPDPEQKNPKLVVRGHALDWCSACVSAALAAHTMQGRYVGFFSGRQEKRASNGETSDR